MIDHEAEQLREALPPTGGSVVVADHGMVDVSDTSRIDVSAHDELRDGVAIVGGEARLATLLHRRSGARRGRDLALRDR